MVHFRIVVSVMSIALFFMFLYAWCYEAVYRSLLRPSSIVRRDWMENHLETVLTSGAYLRVLLRRHGLTLETFTFIVGVPLKLVVECTRIAYWNLWLFLMRIEVSFLDLLHTSCQY
jgi:hypothetical protein